eukprot:TRINITY_DN10129_c0_g1_i1.p1 TRINITY_DN10129_c0_g1~~TRINITY_DN10129_c0_g1_i1.p1  ORF type:complete len:509 (+),score=58.46 TRINITY_DN10129_c0_g1_i1:146-1672(+)
MAWAEWCLAAAVTELLFYVYLRLKSRKWRQPLDVLSGDFPKARRGPVDILRVVEDHMSRSRQDAEDFLSKWHFDVPFSKIRREDAEEFLIWSAFTRRQNEISAAELRLVASCLDRVEKAAGLQWNAETNSSLPGHPASAQKFAAHTWESKCSYNHWPLFVYLMLWFVKRVIGTPCLLLLGFRYRRQGFLGYWVREKDCRCGKRRQDGQQESLVFFHGIGPGLAAYLQFLMRFRHQKVILIELHWVTFNPFDTEVPEANMFCNTVADLLDANSVTNACFSAHSYGSFMVAWLLPFPRMEGRITRVVIVSGPALNLFISKTCKSVCYDKPIWFEYCLAHIFFRQFFWHQCVLTASDLPKASTVVVVENDELIPVADVVRDCADQKVRCHVVPRITHGCEIVFPIACSKVVQFIRMGHGEPLKNDKGVSLFFHGAQSSKLYGWFYDLSLRALDAVTSLFCMYGHSPFDLQMLSYIDELWPGGRRSLSSANLAASTDASDDDDDTTESSKTK